MVVALAAVFTMAASVPASATSCIAPTSPRETIEGTGDRAMSRTFFDQYSVAVLGRVVTVNNAPQPGGGTRIEIDVDGAIGVTTVAPSMTLSADDDGAMNGFPFAVGTSYFIPVQAKGPQGQPNYTFVCDPIGEIDGSEGAGELLALARRNGHPVAVPGTGAAASPQPGPAAGEAGGPGTAANWPLVLTLVAAAAGTAALGAVVLLRRRRPA